MCSSPMCHLQALVPVAEPLQTSPPQWADRLRAVSSRGGLNQEQVFPMLPLFRVSLPPPPAPASAPVWLQVSPSAAQTGWPQVLEVLR